MVTSMRAKDVTNEGLAAILRTMAATGVITDSDELEYIREAADRLEREAFMIIVEGVEVKVWPDNDGGMWYYHPITGEEVRIP